MGDKPFLLIPATPSISYEAEEVYQSALQEGLEEGLFTDDELLDWLASQGFWNDEKSAELVKIPKDIEDIKVRLFESAFKSKEKEKYRDILNNAKRALSLLMSERHAYDFMTAEGYATLTKTRFLISKTLRTLQGRRVPSNRCEAACHAYAAEKLGETTFRELARTDPWRSIWSTRKCEGSLFGRPAVCLSDEQKTIVGWSQLYDSVYESPKRPMDEVVTDDDMLDGWLISQRKANELSLNQNSAESMISKNEAIQNSQEIFTVVDTIEDAKKIESLNDEWAKRLKRQRHKVIQEKGTVDEMELPDMKQKIQILKNGGTL